MRGDRGSMDFSQTAVSARLTLVFSGAEGILLSVKPDTEVCEGHGGGLGDDRIPGRQVRPAAHRPPGHDARLGLIDKQTPAVRARVGSSCGFNLGNHKAVQSVAICHRGAPWVFQHGSSVRGRIGKKGATYAACFRDLMNDWGVSRFWASADRCVAA